LAWRRSAGLARRDRQRAERAVAENAHLEGTFDRPVVESAVEIVDRVRGAAGEGHDDVALRDAGRRGRTVRLDAEDLDPRLVPDAEAPREAALERAVLTGDAEPAAPHVAEAHQLTEHLLRGVDRDREADPLRAEDHRRVDPDDAPAAVDERPARVA